MSMGLRARPLGTLRFDKELGSTDLWNDSVNGVVESRSAVAARAIFCVKGKRCDLSDLFTLNVNLRSSQLYSTVGIHTITAVGYVPWYRTEKNIYTAVARPIA